MYDYAPDEHFSPLLYPGGAATAALWRSKFHPLASPDRASHCVRGWGGTCARVQGTCTLLIHHRGPMCAHALCLPSYYSHVCAFVNTRTCAFHSFLSLCVCVCSGVVAPSAWGCVQAIRAALVRCSRSLEWRAAMSEEVSALGAPVSSLWASLSHHCGHPCPITAATMMGDGGRSEVQ